MNCRYRTDMEWTTPTHLYAAGVRLETFSRIFCGHAALDRTTGQFDLLLLKF